MVRMQEKPQKWCVLPFSTAGRIIGTLHGGPCNGGIPLLRQPSLPRIPFTHPAFHPLGELIVLQSPVGRNQQLLR